MDIRGVDFSGSADPGSDLWITDAVLESGTLSVTDCDSAAQRFSVTKREQVLTSLRESLVTNRGTETTGLDVSFGLPGALLPDGVDTWRAAIEWFVGTFDADADAMRNRLKERARQLPGEGVELKRRTDDAVGANSPYSFITYYQTLYGIRSLLWPLVRSESVQVPPMEPAGNRNIIEIYPAGTLRRLGTVDSKYKSDTETARQRRVRIVDRLTDRAAPETPGVELPASIRRTIIEEPGGDALDSVIATLAAARAAERDFEPEEPFDPVEGCIYV